MERNIFKLLYMLALLVFVSCDDLSMTERVEGAPEIQAFSPQQGSIGMEIEIEGERLSDVVSASLSR